MTEKPDHYYQQSAVIPYRLNAGHLLIMVISSRKRKRWVIPKGIKEPELSSRRSAAKEAAEEAGISGKVSVAPIGEYQYRKWGGVCRVEVFTMAVEQELDEWPESFRDREWVELEEAVARVQETDLKQLLRKVPDFIASTATPLSRGRN